MQPGGDRVITNVVFMGMGEPLANYRNVVPAAEILMDDLGFDISRRRVTVSTSGLVPQMLRLAEETNCALAVSLHAPNDALRDQLVPINRKHPIAELLDACWQYVNKQNARSITFEYVMLDGVNDHPEHAHELVQLLQGPAGEGESDSVQPVPGDALRALQRGGDRTVPRDPQYERRDRDDPAHARRRHRRRLRPAGRSRQRPHDSAPGLEAHLSGGATVKRAATIVTRGLVVLAMFLGGCTSNDEHRSKPQPERAAEINLELGVEHLRKGNLQQAKDKIDRALEQNPRYGRAHLRRRHAVQPARRREQGGLALSSARCRSNRRIPSSRTTTRSFCASTRSTSAARRSHSKQPPTRCTRRPRWLT